MLYKMLQRRGKIYKNDNRAWLRLIVERLITAYSIKRCNLSLMYFSCTCLFILIEMISLNSLSLNYIKITRFGNYFTLQYGFNFYDNNQIWYKVLEFFTQSMNIIPFFLCVFLYTTDGFIYINMSLEVSFWR